MAMGMAMGMTVSGMSEQAAHTMCDLNTILVEGGNRPGGQPRQR